MTASQLCALLMLSPLFLLAIAFSAWTLAQIIREERARMSEQRREPVINFRTQRVGGLRFVRVGRFCASFCITRAAR